MFAVSRHAFRRLSSVELSPCARVFQAMKTEHSSSSLGVKLLCLLSVFQGTGAQQASVESILVADLLNKAIYKVDATTGSKETLPLGPLPNPVAVDYDATSGYLYWTDSQAHQVQRAYLNGTGMEVIASTSTMVPDGVALDIPGGNVYWTDTSRDAISVARMDGRFPRNVLTTGLDQPRAIALDPANGYMYWTDWGAQAKIERAAMDGTGRTALVTTGLLWPNGLTIDKSAQRLYWCDGRTYKIESSDLNGYDRQQFYLNFGFHFFGIAVDDTHLYWTAWTYSSIVRSSKTTGVHETIGTGLSRPAGIQLIKSGTYQPVSNACTSQNGGCQHLCLARPGGRTCACRSSWRLQDDGVTCQPLVIVPPSVVWTRRDHVTGINIVEMLPGNTTTIRDGLGFGGSLTVKNLFSVNPPSFLTALDFDIRRQQMFWTDSGLQAIHKIDFLNEASVATILKGTSSSVQGLAVDWLNQNLYYTDAFYNWIGLFNTNSSNHHVVVQTGLYRPQGIAVDPSRGQIFWSDRGREPKIERATLSGQNRTVLVRSNIQAPHGMVIDYVRNRLYWADSGLDIIGYYDLDDGTRSIYRYSPGTHFFDISFDGAGILATDQSGNDLHVIVDGEDVIEAQLRAQPHGVAFFHESRQQWQQTDCQVNNGGCQHTCVGDAGGHRCLCLLGYSLGDDNHSCTEDAGLPSVALLFSSDAGVHWLRHDLPDVPSDVSVSLGTLISGLRVVAMDVNYAGKMLFYTQDVADGTQRIYRRSLIHGSTDAPHFIYAGGSNIEGIAVDWVASNLYWTERSHGQIQVARLDGGFRKVIVSGLDQPLGVAVHPREGFLFWTESGTTPRVARATLAGTETRTLVSGFSVNQPRGLAIDFLEDRIYWVDGFHGTVQSCDVNGENVVSHSLTGAFDLSGITIYKDYVLMTDSDNRRLVIGLRQHDGQFGVHRTVSGLGTEPHNIRMYDGNEQLSHPGPCDEDNGGCGDLCLPVPNGRVCSCGEGRFLQLDGRNCGLNVPVTAPVPTTTQAPVVTTTTRETTTTSTQRASTTTSTTLQPSTTTTTTQQPSTTTTTVTTLQHSTTTTTTRLPSTTTTTTQQPSTTTTTTTQPSTTTTTTTLQPSTTTSTTLQPSTTTSTTPQPSTTTSTTLQPSTTTTTTQQPSTTTSTTLQPSTTTSTTPQRSTTTSTTLQPSTTTSTTQKPSTTTSTTQQPSTTTSTTPQHSTTTTSTLQPSPTQNPSTTTTTTQQPTTTTTTTTLQPSTSTSTRTLQPSTASTASPPTFENTCPNGQSLSFDLSADGRVFINLTLTATDGEGTPLQVEGSVSLPGYVDYEPGRQHWSFQAVDRRGRTATCSFDVTIIDSHPPTIHNCPGNITMETATDGVTVTWDAPTAVDNSGRDVTLTASKDPGSRFYFADPQNIVTYTARDTTGNTATCDFWIILKSASSTCSERDLPTVTNGYFGACSVSDGVKSCPVVCNDSNNRLTPSTRVIRCQPDGRWETGVYICSRGRSPLSVSSSASFSITTAPCHDDAGFLHTVTSNMVDHFGQTGVCWSASRNSVPLCESGNDGTFPNIRLSCRQNNVNSRKRRDLATNSRGRRDVVENSRGWRDLEANSRELRDLTDAILFTSRESVIHLMSDNLSNRALRDVGGPSPKISKETEQSVENIVITNPAGKSQSRRVKREEGGIDVLLEMKINMAAGDVSSVHHAEERLRNVIDDVRTRVTTGDVVVRVNDVTYTADADSFSSTEITVDCPKDTEKKGNLCVEKDGPDSSGLSTTTIIGIGVGAAACVLIICTIVIVWCRGNRYKLQRPTRRNSQLNTFHNPAFADPIYDVINDKPMAPPVVTIPLEGRRVAGNEYAENPGPLGDDGGYEIPPAARAPPTTFMPNYSQERGRLQNDADVDHDYSYPNKESGPYQALGGTFQRHHEYQSLAGIGQRRQHPGNENDGRGANQQRQTNVVPMATGPVNNNNDHGQAVTFNWRH